MRSIRSEIKDFCADFDPRKNIYDRVLIYLIVVSSALRILWLNNPPDPIFDGKFYVNAARIILGLASDPRFHVGATPGIDPSGHAPLATGIITFFIMIFGDNAYSFRAPSVIFGIFSILIFYILAKKLSANPKLALIASFLYSFDNLVFITSRIAMLDIFMLAFMILGFYFCINNKMVLSAITIALSVLSKYTGALAIGVIIAYYLLKKSDQSKNYNFMNRLKGIERFIIVFFVTFLSLHAFLGWLYGGYINPFNHMFGFISYAAKLARPQLEGIASYPWQWLMNEAQIPYYVVTGRVTHGGEYIMTVTLKAFIGAMTPAIIYLTIPSIAYTTYRYVRIRDNASLFILLWFIFTYLPYYPMSLIMHRIMYIFYFLSAIPAVCLAISYGIWDLRSIFKKHTILHLIIICVYLAMVLFGFYMLFPFKTFP